MYMYVCICQCIELSWKLLLCCVLWWAFGPLVVAPGTGFASWSKMGHQILRQCGASSRSALPCNFGDENHMFLQWETLILAVFEMLPASSVYRSRRYTSSRKMTWNPKFTTSPFVHTDPHIPETDPPHNIPPGTSQCHQSEGHLGDTPRHFALTPRFTSCDSSIS